MVTISTVAAKAPSGYEYLSLNSDAVELEAIFDHVSNGLTARVSGYEVKVVTRTQYMDFFNTTGETRYGQYVVAKFECHDVNGDGVLTLDEVNVLC